jgi:glycosyltransferase involved in cell wall biosynthesis
VDTPEAVEAVRKFLSDEEVIATSGGQGGARARNLGLAASASRYVAYLDDDDWWDPGHLAHLVSTAERSGATLVLGAAIFHGERGPARVLPGAALTGSVADYAVLRPRLKFGYGLVQSSCILIDRDSLGQTPWDADMPKHQDWDYVLRLVQAGAVVAQSTRPFAHIWQGSAHSVSRSHAWRSSAAWYERHHDALSTRARGDFVAAHVLRSAASTRDVEGVAYAARELIRHRPHAAAIAVGLSGLASGLRKQKS